MIVECAYCESKVDGEILAENQYWCEEAESTKEVFLKCPVCKCSVVVSQDLYLTGYDEYEWSDPNRVWPRPDNSFHYSIPQMARHSLDQARNCFKVKAYDACAVMSGRAIEAICVEKTGEKSLYKGLRVLKEKDIIDSRLFQWGESLRIERNFGAHANDENITRDDAQDVLDFAVAICEYVYFLAEKYEEFLIRKKARNDKKSNNK